MAQSTRFPALTIPTICTTDVAQVAAQLISEAEDDFLAVQNVAKTYAPGDPVRLLLLRFAARESQYRSLLNFGFQQNFIISGIGDALDAWGGNLGTGNTLGTDLSGARLQASAAVTTLQFSIGSILGTSLAIPQDTLVSAGPVTFATDTLVQIPAGGTSVTVTAHCTQTGVVGNGYTAGQINTITYYALPYVITVANTTTSQGGADIESDDVYAQRLGTIPGAFSCAGPIGAYKAWARKASSSIIDVSIITPNTTPSVAAGNVNICVLLGPAGGGSSVQIPNSGFLTQVANFFTNDIRPQGDVVTVIAPTVTNYTINGTYYISPDMVSLQSQIDAAVQAAMQQFIVYTSSKVGRTINPDYLSTLITNAGASDVVLTTPTRTVLDIAHVGMVSGTPTMTYAGTEI